MAFCRTKAGTLRIVSEGREYLLDGAGLELPDKLAEEIRPHVNVIVDERAPAPAPESKARKPAKDADGA